LYGVIAERTFFQNIQNIVRSIAAEEKGESEKKETINGSDEAGPSIPANTASGTEIGSDLLQLLFTKERRANAPKDEKSKGAVKRQVGKGRTGHGNASVQAEPMPYVTPYVGTELDPKQTGWVTNIDVRPHIRASLTDINLESEELASRDTGLSICTLGSGAGISSRLRSHPATIIKSTDGDSYLVDCGEGVHRQLYVSRMNIGDIQKILGKYEKSCFGRDAIEGFRALVHLARNLP